MITKKVLEFYRKTSPFTDLGLYSDFAKNLPNDIEDLCLLQINKIIHPFDLSNEVMRNDSNSLYGNMTKVSKTTLRYENDIFPTAQAILAELLRRDKNYSINRKIEDKVHVCCREQAILLASILKSKNIPARTRSGFAKYVNTSGTQAGDHWITEYYSATNKRWTLVDADMYFDKDVLDFDLLDIPYEKFIFSAEAYLGIREKRFKRKEIYYASSPLTFGLNASIRGLFFDFHCLMNDEIIFLHLPKYIVDKNFKLSEEEFIELDNLAKLMLDPDKNFDTLLSIWENNEKFRIMSGGLND